MSRKKHAPRISAAICTRGRGDSIVCAVSTILANTHPDFELVIVDQSPEDDTERAVTPFLRDSRLRYVRSQERGLSRARNLAIREARAEIIAFTDDDCEVPTDWLEKIEAAFQERPEAAIVFCNVAAGPFDPQQGFIPAYTRPDRFLATSIDDKNAARGIGAGIALRKSVIESLGGFDSMLGAGSEYCSCEDGDLAVRILLKGLPIYETNSVTVIHHGFRTFEEGKALGKRDYFGMGASYAKPLRCGHWRFMRVVACEFFVYSIWPTLRDALHLRRPRGISRSYWFLRGFLKGWNTPINRETLCFDLPQARPLELITTETPTASAPIAGDHAA